MSRGKVAAVIAGLVVLGVVGVALWQRWAAAERLRRAQEAWDATATCLWGGETGDADAALHELRRAAADAHAEAGPTWPDRCVDLTIALRRAARDADLARAADAADALTPRVDDLLRGRGTDFERRIAEPVRTLHRVLGAPSTSGGDAPERAESLPDEAWAADALETLGGGAQRRRELHIPAHGAWWLLVRETLLDDPGTHAFRACLPRDDGPDLECHAPQHRESVHLVHGLPRAAGGPPIVVDTAGAGSLVDASDGRAFGRPVRPGVVFSDGRVVGAHYTAEGDFVSLWVDGEEVSRHPIETGPHAMFGVGDAIAYGPPLGRARVRARELEPLEPMEGFDTAPALACPVEGGVVTVAEGAGPHMATDAATTELLDYPDGTFDGSADAELACADDALRFAFVHEGHAVRVTCDPTGCERAESELVTDRVHELVDTADATYTVTSVAADGGGPVAYLAIARHAWPGGETTRARLLLPVDREGSPGEDLDPRQTVALPHRGGVLLLIPKETFATSHHAAVVVEPDLAVRRAEVDR